MAKSSAYIEWEQSGELQEKLNVITSLSMQGLNHDNIGKEVGISGRQLRTLQKKHPPLASALKKGRLSVVAMAQSALMRRVADGDTTAIIYCLKVYGGEFFNDQKPFIELKRREVIVKEQELKTMEASRVTETPILFEVLSELQDIDGKTGRVSESER